MLVYLSQGLAFIHWVLINVSILLLSDLHGKRRPARPEARLPREPVAEARGAGVVDACD